MTRYSIEPKYTTKDIGLDRKIQIQKIYTNLQIKDKKILTI